MDHATNIYFSSYHQDALRMDVDIFQLVLKRYKSSQKKTKYYQRSMMCLKCFIGTSTKEEQFQQQRDIRTFLITLTTFYEQYQSLQKRIIENENKIKKRKKREDIFWEYNKNTTQQQQQQNETTTSTTNINEVVVDQQQMELQNDIIEYNDSIVLFFRNQSKWIVETLHRIQYASGCYISECMVRGFFLPFSTIAISCLARIRILLIAFCSELIHEKNDNTKFSYSTLIRNITTTTTKMIPSDLLEEQDRIIQQAKSTFLHCIEQSTKNSTKMWDPIGSNLSRMEKTHCTLKSLGLNHVCSQQRKNHQQNVIGGTSSGKMNTIHNEIQHHAFDRNIGMQNENMFARIHKDDDNNIHDNDVDDDMGDRILPERGGDYPTTMPLIHGSSTSKTNDDEMDRNNIILESITTTTNSTLQHLKSETNKLGLKKKNKKDKKKKKNKKEVKKDERMKKMMMETEEDSSDTTYHTQQQQKQIQQPPLLLLKNKTKKMKSSDKGGGGVDFFDKLFG